MVRILLLFLTFLLVGIVGAEILWSYKIQDQIYHCTDETGFGFVYPGDWVHEQHGDTFSDNWGSGSVWILCGQFALATLLVAIILTLVAVRIWNKQNGTKTEQAR